MSLSCVLHRSAGNARPCRIPVTEQCKLSLYIDDVLDSCIRTPLCFKKVCLFWDGATRSPAGFLLVIVEGKSNCGVEAWNQPPVYIYVIVWFPLFRCMQLPIFALVQMQWILTIFFFLFQQEGITIHRDHCYCMSWPRFRPDKLVPWEQKLYVYTLICVRGGERER